MRVCRHIQIARCIVRYERRTFRHGAAAITMRRFAANIFINYVILFLQNSFRRLTM